MRERLNGTVWNWVKLGKKKQNKKRTRTSDIEMGKKVKKNRKMLERTAEENYAAEIGEGKCKTAIFFYSRAIRKKKLGKKKRKIEGFIKKKIEQNSVNKSSATAFRAVEPRRRFYRLSFSFFFWFFFFFFYWVLGVTRISRFAGGSSFLSLQVALQRP